ncbi:MAG: methyltetrahydrofolate cobalamin methyltransferase [Deltaproteobacteria bacterium]|nr:methyltetrahydrofolate cobalamin methyltransferase [Deltaproteobacteria bacterium]
MLIVGELINASRESIAGFIEAKDNAAIGAAARNQLEAGATYLDVNAGVFVDDEAQYLRWLVETVQSAVDAPCCIDSPDPRAIEAALSVHRGTAMINSISLEKDRYDKLLPILAGTDLKVVALCMSDEGMPKTAEQRLRIADKLINGLVSENVLAENIYVDPLVQPVATNTAFGKEFLEAVARIGHEFKGVHTMCGLSNISFGLPVRKLLNQTFMVMAVTSGLDGAIMDPLDKKMMAVILAAETLIGRDDFCMKYLSAYRGKKFQF